MAAPLRLAVAPLKPHGFMQDALAVCMAGPDQSVETFLCPICCENTDEAEWWVAEACGDKAHGICRACVCEYLKGRIWEGRVQELVCPVGAAGSGCPATCSNDATGASPTSAVIRENELEALFVGETLEVVDKYRRFRQIQANPCTRECPGCKALCEPKRSGEDGVLVAQMRCSSCGAEFCYYHSWGHRSGGSCAAYEARLVRETRANAAAFGTKACPSCFFETEKAGGCNHMGCTQCKCDWCWVCGQKLEGSIGWHYSSQNATSGCHQFSPDSGHPDMDAVRAVRTRLAKLRLWLFPMRCLVWCVMLCLSLCWVSLMLLPLVLVWVVGLCRRRKCGEGVAGISVACWIILSIPCVLLLLALELVWLPFGLLLWLFQRFDPAISSFLLCVPLYTSMDLIITLA